MGLLWINTDDPRCHAAGPKAAGFWIGLLCYWSRTQSTTYFIATEMLVEVWPKMQRRTAATLAATLVDTGLLDQVDGGFRIHDPADFRPVDPTAAGDPQDVAP